MPHEKSNEPFGVKDAVALKELQPVALSDSDRDTEYQCDEQQQASAESMPPMSKLFYKMETTDWVLAAVGGTCAVIYGVSVILFYEISIAILEAIYRPGAEVESIVGQACLYLFLYGVGSTLFAAGQWLSFKFVTDRQMRALRIAVFDALLKMPQEYFDETTPAQMHSMLGLQLGTVQRNFNESFGSLICHSARCVGGLAWAFYRCWPLATLWAGSLPLSVFVVIAISTITTKYTLRSLEAQRAGEDKVAELLQNTRIIQFYHTVLHEVEQYAAILKRSAEQALTAELAANGSRAAGAMMLYVYYTCVIWIGFRLRQDDLFSGPTIVNVAPHCFNMLVSLSALSGVMSNLNSSRLALLPLLEILNKSADASTNEQRTSSSSVSFASASTATATPQHEDTADTDVQVFDHRHTNDVYIGSIEMRDGKFSYDSPRRSLHISDTSSPRKQSIRSPGSFRFKAVNFEARGGEPVAIIGRTGSGKTTLASLLLRHCTLNSGTLLVNGVDAATTDRDWYYRRVAYCPQDPILFHDTILENVRLGRPTATDDEVMDACRRTFVHDDISHLPLQYATLCDANCGLSGGQRQRICLARGLLRDPDVLILDEPTSALDDATEALVNGTLMARMADPSRITIVITHRTALLHAAKRVYSVEDDECNARSFRLLSEDEVSEYASATNLVMQKRCMPRKLTMIEDEDGVLRNPLQSSRASVAEVFRALYRGLEGNRHMLTYGCIGGAFFAMHQPVYGYIWARATDLFSKPLTAEGQIETHILACSMLASSLLASVGWTLMGYFAGAGEVGSNKLREEALHATLQRQDLANVAPVVQLLGHESYDVRYLWRPVVGAFVMGTISFGIGFGIAFSYSWKLTLVALAIFPVSILVGLTDDSLAKTAVNAVDPVMNTIVYESLRHVRMVKELHIAESCVRRLANELQRQQRANLPSAIAYGMSYAAGNLGWAAHYALLFWYGIKLFTAGEIDFLGIVVVAQCTFRPAALIGELIVVSKMTVSGFTACSAIMHSAIDSEKLNAPTDIAPGDETEAVVVSVKNLSCVKQGNVAESRQLMRRSSSFKMSVVRGITCTFAPCSHTAIIGPSGCGKTTLLNVLCGFGCGDVDGEVSVVSTERGELIHDPSELASLRPLMGYASQQPQLFGGTIAENIAYGTDGPVDESWLRRCAAAACLLDDVDAMPEGFSFEVGHSGSRLSGGQRMRVSLARALYRRPRILLLDEVTASIDKPTSKRMVRNLTQWAEDTSSVVISVLHDRQAAASCDAMVELASDGSVIERQRSGLAEHVDGEKQL